MKLKSILNTSILSLFLSMSCTYIANANHTDMTEYSIIKNIGGTEDDTLSCSLLTRSNELIVAGVSYSSGNGDITISKYDKSGNELWVKSWGGSKYESPYAIKELENKDIICIGYSSSSDAGFEYKGGNDVVIIRLDKDGNQLWVKSWGGSYDDYLCDVIETDKNELICVGNSISNDAGFNAFGRDDAIIVKYDEDGNHLWTKSFGGANYDYFSSIIKMSDKTYTVIGGSNSTDTVLGEAIKGRDVIMARYNDDGELLWVKNYGGTNDESVRFSTKTQNDDLLISGYSYSDDFGFDKVENSKANAITIRIDKNGELLWCTNAGFDNYFYSFSKAKEAKNGNIVSIGYHQVLNYTESSIEFITTGMIMECDANGNVIYKRDLLSTDYCTLEDIIILDGNNYILIGYNSEDNQYYDNKGKRDGVVILYNNNYESIFNSIKNSETSKDIFEISNSRQLVNQIPESVFKERFQKRLNQIDINLSLERKTATFNVDIYIKSENMLLLSLNTNQITFEDFSGIDDMLKDDAVEININSSLPYSLNAYLMTEIQNADKSQTMDKEILQLKEDSEVDYQYFENINEKIILKSSCDAGNDKTHLIDFKLKGSIAHEKDVYKTVVKFEAEQV